MTTVKPEVARKAAAFVEAINKVCESFDMEMSMPEEGLPLYMNVSSNEPDEVPFVIVWDPDDATYDLGFAGTTGGD